MDGKIYPWHRFWHKPDLEPLLEDGFLRDPTGQYGHIFNPNVVDFSQLVTLPCLALIGAPGMGKSHAFDNQAELQSRESELVLRLNLRTVGSDILLMRNLFDTQEYRKFSDGQPLTICLDSFDECVLRVETLVPMILHEFRKIEQSRLRTDLRLRITSRPTSWNQEIDDGLSELWGEGYAVYHLAPLRREDVHSAARMNKLDADEFLSDVLRKDVGPLAANPITLKFLFAEYASLGGLPSTMSSLYLSGCRRLCEEPQKHRRKGQISWKTSDEQRLAIASRVAAMTVLAGRDAIWQGADSLDAPSQDISVKDIRGGTELVEEAKTVVNESQIFEVLATPLFVSSGPNRVAWSHFSYAEFLAAHYIIQRRMPLTQVMNVLRVTGDPQGRIVPQLAGTAAWLASIDPVFFNEIVRTDPLILIRSDLETVSETTKRQYIDLLLERLADGRSSPEEIGDRRIYAKLGHSEIVSQLRPFVSNRKNSASIRTTAIDIADACNAGEITGDLLHIVLNSREAMPLRIAAAVAISRIGSDSDKARLRPIALYSISADTKLRLRAACLSAVWPNHISAQELFKNLPLPEQDGTSTLFRHFITSRLASGLSNEDLPFALHWLAKSERSINRLRALGKINDDVVTLAWSTLHSLPVQLALAKLVIARRRAHSSFITYDSQADVSLAFKQQPEKRRELLLAVLRLAQQSDISALVYSSPRLVSSDDVHWLLKNFQIAKSHRLRESIASTIWTVLDWTDVDAIDAVLTMPKRTILGRMMARVTSPVVLASEEAHEMRATYAEMANWSKDEEEDNTQKNLQPSPKEQVHELLVRCEQDSIDYWWQLNRVMTLEADSVEYGSDYETKLTKLPGWGEATPKTRDRIVATAKKYVLTHNARPEEWFIEGKNYRPALAGYRALRLLNEIETGFVHSLSGEVWSDWIPILIALPIDGPLDEEDRSSHRELLSYAYRRNYASTVEWINNLIHRENAAFGSIRTLQSLPIDGDERLSSELLKTLDLPDITLDSYRVLFRWLISRDSVGAVEHARIALSVQPITENALDKVVAILEGLYFGKHNHWLLIHNAFISNLELARRFFVSVANLEGRYGNRITTMLREQDLGDLYIFLERLFPREGGSQLEGTHTQRQRGDIARYQNAIINYIINTNTEEACRALKRIYGTFPEFNWLPRVIRQAEADLHRRSWEPVQPRQIFELAQSNRKRLVQSAEDLVDLILESITRFEEKLQGSPPLAASAWDNLHNMTKTPYRPKSENEFSDLLMLHLREDIKDSQLVINREVVIRQKYSTPGQRTDILVQATPSSPKPNGLKVIGVIIEVKGNWNIEVNTGLVTQLAERYLASANLTHGVFLVGWFNCAVWDSSDPRYDSAHRRKKETLEEQFLEQIAAVKQNGFSVVGRIINAALP